jgi:2-dehydropantoate 2-reductase
MPPLTSYTIVGAGAIGGTIAHGLARAGHPVRIVDTDTDHVLAVRARGMTSVEVDGTESTALGILATTPDEDVGGSLDRVVLAVKSQDTAQASQWIAPRLDRGGFVLSCQNGDNEPELTAAVGSERVLMAFVNTAADWVAPGRIEQKGVKSLVIGETSGAKTARVIALAADLSSACPVSITDNIRGTVWSKKSLAAMYTASALADIAIADAIDRYRTVMVEVAREVLRIATALEYPLTAFDGFDPLRIRDGMSSDVVDAAINDLVAWQLPIPKNRSGVFRDITVRHRETEAHAALRSTIRRSEQHGLEAPVSRALDEMLTELETGTRRLDEDNFVELRRAVPRTAGSIAPLTANRRTKGVS